MWLRILVMLLKYMKLMNLNLDLDISKMQIQTFVLRL